MGIVERVNFGTIVVIEGNKSNKVARRYIENNAKFIRGYGIPRYEEEKKVHKEKETSKQKKEVREIAKEVINGKWGNGEDRKNRLEKAGYNYSEVQSTVNNKLSVELSGSSNMYYSGNPTIENKKLSGGSKLTRN